jgi:hypothetical protein
VVEWTYEPWGLDIFTLDTHHKEDLPPRGEISLVIHCEGDPTSE